MISTFQIKTDLRGDGGGVPDFPDPVLVSPRSSLHNYRRGVRRHGFMVPPDVHLVESGSRTKGQHLISERKRNGTRGNRRLSFNHARRSYAVFAM